MKKQKRDFKVVTVIAAYNEERTIAAVLQKVAKYTDKIIVVDDGSTDRTVDRVKGRKVTLLKHLVNLGQGAALQTGFDYCKRINPDVVITFDADGQHKASDIEKLVAPILEDKADVVLGSRFLGQAIDIPRLRYLVLKLGIVFTRVYTGLKLTDTHNGFRAFSGKAIKEIEIKHNRWTHPSDILYQIGKNKFRVKEVPTTIYYTKYSKGKSETVRQTNLDAIRIPIKLIIDALLGV